MVTGETMSIGRIRSPITINNSTKFVNFHVVEGFKHPVLLGLDAGHIFDIHISLRHKLITVNHHHTFSAHIIDQMIGPETSEHDPKCSIAVLKYPPSDSDINLTHQTSTINVQKPTGQALGPTTSAYKSSSTIESLLNEFEDVFATEQNPVGVIPNVFHKIETTTHTPIYIKPYRKPQTEHDLTRSIVTDLRAKGLVEGSHSSYGFPTTVARKKNGEPRLCIDYRELNKVTVSDKFGVPQIQDVLDQLQGSRFFSTLDMAWGYWHVPMDPESIPKTAFVTQDGLYQWKVMPFGLKNAPSTLQRALRNILGPMAYKCTINYLDDIIVYSKSESEHMNHLKEVLTRLRQNNIKLRFKKCSFMTEEVEFLGFKINHDNVSPNPDKVKALQEYPAPKTRKQVYRFLGLCSYFRAHIPRYTETAYPLTRLTRKSVPFKWTEEEKTSFNSLRNSLQGPTTLKLFNPNLPSELHTDASKVGIGAILIQRDQDQSPRIIACFSKRLSKEQENWNTTEQEGLAVVEAIEKFDCYLRPYKFTVYTDNSALTWIANSSKLKGKLLRWFMRLQPYTFDIYHRKGSLNQHVDALSRAPVNKPSGPLPCTYDKGTINDLRTMGNKQPSRPQALAALSSATNQHTESSFLELISNILEGPSDSSHSSPALSHVATVRGWNPNHTLPFTMDTLRQAQEAADLTHIGRPIFQNGIMCIRDKKRSKRNVVPPSLINTVLQFYHENHGHYSTNKTTAMINRYYWWPTIGQDIKYHVSSCLVCQRFKSPSGPGLGDLQLMPTPNKPFELLSMDTIVMGATAKNTSRKYIQVIIDHHSRFIWTLATKNNNAQAAITTFNKLVDFRPKALITDNGSNFTSKIFRSYLLKNKVKHILTTTYHPASNGMVERVNQTLIDRLKFLADQNNHLCWSTLLQDATGIYNSTPHDVTEFTPNYLLTGIEEVPAGSHTLPLDMAREQAAIKTAQEQRRRKEIYDKNHLNISFSPGDLVMRRIPRNHPDYQDKLAPKQLGPYTVVRKTGPVNYIITDDFSQFKTHLDQLVPYIERNEPAVASLSLYGGGCDGSQV